MHIIWENLMAAMLVMVIALILVVVNARNQATLTESTAYYALKSQGLAFTEVLKRDLQGVEEVFMHAETDSTFRFRAHIGSDETIYTIEYRRRWTSRRHVEQDDGTVEAVDFYEIQRYVDGERHGGSMAALTDWEIRALNEQNGQLAAGGNLEDCRKIHVRFEAASPYVETEAFDRMRWESIFVPPLRSRSDVI